MRDLNTAYRGERALHEVDADQAGFEWIDANDAETSVISYLRKGARRATRCWSYATSPWCRGTTTASASLAAAFGRKSSTATPHSTAAAARATSAAP